MRGQRGGAAGRMSAAPPRSRNGLGGGASGVVERWTSPRRLGSRRIDPRGSDRGIDDPLGVVVVVGRIDLARREHRLERKSSPWPVGSVPPGWIYRARVNRL